MNHYTIVKLEADRAAVEDGIVQHFNEYMQSRAKAPSFVEQTGGYFRIECSDSMPATSAGIAAFGNFLTASGYSIRGISTGMTHDAKIGTEVCFSGAGGKKECVVISTLNVY